MERRRNSGWDVCCIVKGGAGLELLVERSAGRSFLERGVVRWCVNWRQEVVRRGLETNLRRAWQE